MIGMIGYPPLDNLGFPGESKVNLTDDVSKAE